MNDSLDFVINSYDLEILHYALIYLYNDCVKLESDCFKSIFPLDHIDDVIIDIEHVSALLNASKSKSVRFTFVDD